MASPPRGTGAAPRQSKLGASRFGDRGVTPRGLAPGDADVHRVERYSANERQPEGSRGRAGDVRMIETESIHGVTSAVLAASRVLVHISARSLAAVEDSVTLPQFRLLVIISVFGPMKLVALAERLAVNPSTAMRMVDRLVAGELVARRANPRDRREIVIDLTEHGRRTVDQVMARRRQEIADIVRRMRPEQRAALIEALSAFAQAGGESTDPGKDRDTLPLGWF